MPHIEANISVKTSPAKDLTLRKGDLLFHKENGGYSVVLRPAGGGIKLITAALNMFQVGDIVDGVASLEIAGVKTLQRFEIEANEEVINLGNFETLAPSLLSLLADVIV